MSGQPLKTIIEALLLAADRALSLDEIRAVFDEDERPGRDELREALADLGEDCGQRGVELKQVASGYRLQVRRELAHWVNRLWEEKPPRYTRALLETLALIAYRQPATRGDIEEVRGVAVSTAIIRTLLDREWIRVAGHRDTPGRPELFVTTRQFLDHFNLKSLAELPPLDEIGESGNGLAADRPDETIVELFAATAAEAEKETEAEVESPDGRANDA
ncbi:MAG: SMC-Scp complex subunit ScpB [Gammaproteobacteria bacterium]|nr:SMC-Scp complex subunit ScpB [Gammaproteobacteria bacterium]